jgi:hypothetical protein
MNITKLTLLTALFSMVTGCSYVTKDQFDALQLEVRETRKIAEEALDKSKEAHMLARDAHETSRRTEETVNRSFRKTMRK